MSIITLAFGLESLTVGLDDIIEMIKSNPLIPYTDRPKYLTDWAAATGVQIRETDYDKLTAID